MTKLFESDLTPDERKEHIEEHELHALENTTCEREWNAQCDAIKKARGGFYPADWYAEVVLSGFMARQMSQPWWRRETTR